MRKCLGCGKYKVKNSIHDYCYNCFKLQEEKDNHLTKEDHFEDNLVGKEIHCVYVMFYGNKNKIGYTRELNSRILENKRKFPNNKFVYFREFTTKSEAMRYEAWLKELSERELNIFITEFHNKVKQLEI